MISRPLCDAQVMQFPDVWVVRKEENDRVDYGIMIQRIGDGDEDEDEERLPSYEDPRTYLVNFPFGRCCTGVA